MSDSPEEPVGVRRREWLASALMGAGLLASYGTLASWFLGFLLPQRVRRTRLLFLGPVSRFAAGGVRPVHDLEGDVILVKRRRDGGFQAFRSTCPHLGCKVHWEPEEERFFCPCHKGVFDADGVATAGPPAEAGQRLSEAPIVVTSGVVYLEVKDPGKRRGRARTA